jgi:hypothetical protein
MAGRTKNNWKELYDGEDHAIYETEKNKKGEKDIVLSIRGIFVYFTPKEFSELIDGVKNASDTLFQPKGGCYQ